MSGDRNPLWDRLDFIKDVNALRIPFSYRVWDIDRDLVLEVDAMDWSKADWVSVHVTDPRNGDGEKLYPEMDYSSKLLPLPCIGIDKSGKFIYMLDIVDGVSGCGIIVRDSRYHNYVIVSEQGQILSTFSLNDEGIFDGSVVGNISVYDREIFNVFKFLNTRFKL